MIINKGSHTIYLSFYSYLQKYIRKSLITNLALQNICTTKPRSFLYTFFRPLMSEKVQFNLEKSINELMKYKKFEILTETELKMVIETRKSFEYKIMRSQKILLDFIEYIEYEKKLEKIIKKRNKNKKVKLKFITKRILYLYKQTLKYFNDDRIIKMYFEYALKRNQISNIKRFITEYITKYPKNIDFIIYAADVSLQMSEYEMAKIIFLKSLRLNTNEKRLYYEFFRTEIMCISNVQKKNKEIGIKENVDISICKNIILQYKEKFGDDIEDFKTMIEDEDIKKMIVNSII